PDERFGDRGVEGAAFQAGLGGVVLPGHDGLRSRLPLEVGLARGEEGGGEQAAARVGRFGAPNAAKWPSGQCGRSRARRAAERGCARGVLSGASPGARPVARLATAATATAIRSGAPAPS